MYSSDNFSDAESIPSPSEYGSIISGREEIEDDLHTGVNQSLAVRRERRHVNMPARYADGASMVVARVKEPRSVKEAINLPERQKSIDAMKAELNALVENGTWEVVDEPKKGTNIVDSKWVLKIKFDADGDVECFKARIFARGFS